jgi:hypothetical protein
MTDEELLKRRETQWDSGRIVQPWRDGLRILWTYTPEMPSVNARSALPWLTVIRWEYDGSGNEGMPTDPRYPISITFYKDEAWSDFQDLIDDFETAEKT